MKLFTPDYYKQFHCIAQACPDSCCKEWEVDVDADSAAFYRTLPGELGDRLRAVLRDTEDGIYMTITDRRCPLWQQDGLCEIQAQLGHEALCQTCRDFPRLRHDYGDFVELGLELSCPEAARLIFSSPALKMSVRELPGGDEPEYDPGVMSTLLRSRREFLAFLDCTDCTPAEVLAVLLLYGCEVQNELDGGEPASLSSEDTLTSARQVAGDGNIENIFAFFRELEILTPQWKSRLDAGAVACDWDRRLFILARYGIQRYWLQAVADYDLIGRIKFIVIACLLVNALGGDIVQTAQQFSKEIENDPDNMDAILDGTYTYTGFTDINLLGLLLNP